MPNIKSITQKDRHGNMFSLELFEPETSVPMMVMIPDMPNGYNGADTDNHPGKPKGTDTVPAWLTPGENVVNAEASRIPGNQEIIDQMNEEGRMMQEAQGGPVPSYAAGGMEIPRPDGVLNSLNNRLGGKNGGPMYAAAGDWVTDDILDRIAMVESGNKHFGDDGKLITSSAGALGKYQWMPKSAANPGFGVDPFDAATATEAEQREKTREYLMGMSKHYPEWSQDDVLMAYNAGPGRIEDAKRGGWNPLTQETLDYVGKIKGANVSGQPSWMEAYFKESEAPEEKVPALTEAQEAEIAAMRAKGYPEYMIGSAVEGMTATAEVGIDRGTLYNKDKPEKEPPTVWGPDNPNDAIARLVKDTDLTEENINDTGADEAKKNPEFFDSVLNSFQNVLGAMFSPNQIARFALGYMGSRAFGFSHDNAMNYAMGDYADQSDLAFKLIEANADNYTTASFNEFISTGDKRDLVLKGPELKMGDDLYAPGRGIVPSVLKDDIPHIWGDPDGDGKEFEYGLHNAIYYNASKVDDKLHSRPVIAKEFLSDLGVYEDAVNKDVEDTEDRAGWIKNPDIAEELSILYHNDMERFAKNPRDAATLKLAAKRAMKKWTEDVAKWSSDPNRNDKIDPRASIMAYYNAENVQMNMGIPASLFDDTHPTKSQEIYDMATKNPSLNTEEKIKEYFRISQGVYNYAKMEKKGGWDFEEVPDAQEGQYSPFTWWLYNLQVADRNPKKEIDNPAVKLLKDNLEAWRSKQK